MRPLPVLATVSFVSRFAIRKFGAILVRASAALVLMWIVLYVSFSGYIEQLERFLNTSSDQAASLLLAWICAAVMLLLFIHSSVVVSLSELLMEPERKQRWPGMRVSRGVWRLYAANLRVLLLVGLGTLAAIGFVHVVTLLRVLPQLGHAFYVDLAYAAVAFLVLVLIARVEFLLAPLALAEQGSIVRRAWTVTSRARLRTAVVIALFAIPGLVVLQGGHSLLVAVGLFPAPAEPLALAGAARVLQSVLPMYLALFLLAYFVSVGLYSLAAVVVYRDLSQPAEAGARRPAAAAPESGSGPHLDECAEPIARRILSGPPNIYS